MPLVYITGISGSGKTTIRDELRLRGFNAYDVDEDDFKEWYNKKTDNLATEQKRWQDASIDWRKQYWLKIQRSKVEKLSKASKAQSKPIFLCGTTPNDHDIWDLFDVVIHLEVSNDTLRKRLAERTNNDYGKHPDDLKNILYWNKEALKRNAGNGAIVINAERPVAEVTDNILNSLSAKYLPNSNL